MGSKLWLTVPTIVVSLVLTFAPVFAQDTTDNAANDAARTVPAAADDDSPDWGWLGLIGLAGLGGLLRRDHERHEHHEHARVERPVGRQAV